MKNCNAVCTPVDYGVKVSKYDFGSKVNAQYFKSLVESFYYLTCTRPNILFDVRLITRFIKKPRSSYLLTAKRIL